MWLREAAEIFSFVILLLVINPVHKFSMPEEAVLIHSLGNASLIIFYTFISVHSIGLMLFAVLLFAASITNMHYDDISES